MLTLRTPLISLLAVLLFGCANVPQDFSFKPNGTTGLVVGSVSYESSFGKYYLVAEDLKSRKIYQFGFGCPIVPCFEPANDEAYSANELPKQRGGGYAVEVPEGDYRIIGWHVVQGYKHSRSSRLVDLRFTVAHDKVSYLGNLHFDADWEAVELRDKSARDLPLLRSTYPVLNSTPFAFTIAPGMRVERLGGEYQSRFEGFVYIPMVPAPR